MEKCEFCGSSEVWIPKSSPIQRYFRNLREAFFKPRTFFRHLAPHGDVNSALCFAVITHWLSRILLYFLSFEKENSNRFISTFFQFGDRFQTYEPKLTAWLQGLWPVLLDPFPTLVKVGLFAVCLFIPLRIFVTPGKRNRPSHIEFSLVLRIVSYLTAASFFELVNGFVFSLIGSVYLWIAIREVYRLDAILTFCVITVACFFSGIASLGSFVISGFGQLFSFFL